MTDQAVLLPKRYTTDASPRSRRWKAGIITMVASMGLMLCTRVSRNQTAKLTGTAQELLFRRNTPPSATDVSGPLNGLSALIAQDEASASPLPLFLGGNCINNWADLHRSCPQFIHEAYCDNVKLTGPGTKFHELCAAACADRDQTFAAVCAWEAVANMPAVCAGTFKPGPPPADDDFSIDIPNQLYTPPTAGTKPGKLLFTCDDYAFCYGCFGDGISRNATRCSLVAWHYGIVALIDERDIAINTEALLLALEHFDEWCAMLDEDNDEYSFYATPLPTDTALDGDEYA